MESRTTEQAKKDLADLWKLNDECAGERFEDLINFKGGPKQILKTCVVLLFAPFLRFYMGRQIRMNHLLIHAAAKTTALELKLNAAMAKISELEKNKNA